MNSVRRQRRTLVVLALVVAMLVPAETGLAAPQAETPSPTPAFPRALQFTRIAQQQGMSNHSVWSIEQDRAGRMWFATLDGLNRYDGYDFEVFRADPDDPHSITSGITQALHEDSAGMLWIGTLTDGLNRFDPRSEQFTRWVHDEQDPSSISSDAVRAIFEDSAGTIWLGTAAGLNRFDRQTGTFTRFQHTPDDPTSLAYDEVYALYEDKAGTLWVATYGGGLDAFDRRSGTFTHYRHDPDDPDSLSNDNTYCVLEDSHGDLWVGTWGGGLNRFDRRTRRFEQFRSATDDPFSLSSDLVTTLHEDQAGDLWVGTYGGGLNRFDRTTRQFVRYRNVPADPDSLSHNNIKAIDEDRAGNLWIGTEGGGANLVSRYRKPFYRYRHNPENPNSLSSDAVRAVLEDRDGMLWTGTFGGLDLLDRRTGQTTHYRHDPADVTSLSSNLVTKLLKDHTGTLWVGTLAGLNRFDAAQGTFQRFQHDPADPYSLSENSIQALFEDRTGMLWVGTYGGLNRLDPSTGRFTVYRHDPADPDGLNDNSIGAIDGDAAGKLWIGTQRGGLNHFDPATGTAVHYVHDPQKAGGVSSSTVVDIYRDPSGILWLATWSGFDRLDPASGIITSFRIKDGLGNEKVQGIMPEDPSSSTGALWLSTAGSLTRFDPRSTTFQNYDANDGLPATGFFLGSVHRAPSGEMFAGSPDGLVAFMPAAITTNPVVPPIVLTDLLIGNQAVPISDSSVLTQSIDTTGSLVLPYDARTIALSFAALNFDAPEENRYRYRLDDFDRQWNEVPSNRRLVTYTNLDPGSYVFRVTGSNNDGVWNPTERTLTITIVPPWWQTLWFRTLAVILLVAAVAGGYRWRIGRLQRQQRVLEAEVAERRRTEAALAASYAEVTNLAGKLITAQETERARIARELHDDINQQLAVLAIGLSGLRRQPGVSGDVAADVQALQQHAGTLADEVRRLSHDLHPAVLEHAGLTAALRDQCAEVARQYRLAVTLDTDGAVDDVPAQVALCLYRIVQEALHNVAKHAHAQHAAVTLRRCGERVDLVVTDDGQGFDVSARRGSGLGLISIDERVRVIRGAVTITSNADGGGTTVRVEVPLQGAM